ncbi:MptD family putative ECF transporter S component [Ruminococcus sp.]|uniref:MptD family putative ECF transporter S component n=1 Tax=Ruminococcus sp. TaxID=41978 RepID=UPI0025EEF9CD|nr:MptD family putative ECF transporter S component [Ruminococcus sp.]MBQ9541667.1 MptD family putative ECF transporter S component [Ruminococcus sp.]
MFGKVKPYMGGYIRYTYAALAVMFAGLIASAVPFFLVYRIIKPLLGGEKLSAGYYAAHIALIFVCKLVYAILYVLGLISFLLTSFSWVIVVTSASAGLLADLVLKAGSCKSIKNCIIASAVYSLWGIGTYISLFFGFRQVYLKSIVDGYGQEYVDKLSAYTPSYMFYVMLAMTFVGGLIGGALGTKVLSKHFRKAGIA